MAQTTPLTLAEMRDAVRRMLQQRPPADIGGRVGAQPADAAHPTNPTLNDCINRAISKLDRAAEWHTSAPISLSVGSAQRLASGTAGPLSLSLINSGVGQVARIQRARWIVSSTEFYDLTPSSQEAMDRDWPGWTGWAQGIPQRIWIYGGNLILLPNPDADGTLEIYGDTGIGRLVSDADTVDTLALSYQDLILVGACVEVSKLTTMDEEARMRAAMYAPDWVEGLREVRRLRGQQMLMAEGSVPVTSYRFGYGTMRLRR